MKTIELQKKSKQELGQDLEEKEIELRDIRFGLAGAKAKDVKHYANLKKDIARIITVLKNK